jgi:hypothetical protein
MDGVVMSRMIGPGSSARARRASSLPKPVNHNGDVARPVGWSTPRVRRAPTR